MDVLTGKFLIAMPGMGDPRFDRSVILMCEHSQDGALGLIVNKPLLDLTENELFTQLSLESPAAAKDSAPIYFGGPVDPSRGFVVHGADYGSDTTLQVAQGVAMTATLQVLQDIAEGNGPAKRRIMLGYSGWGPGQIEAELQQNGWLAADPSEALIFAAEPDAAWAGALESLGINPLLLSEAGGRA